MSVLGVINAIIAVSKALPVLASFVDKLTEMWTQRQIEDIKDQSHEIHKQKKALVNAIRNAPSDEERVALSVVLSKLRE